jgi:hypothetical protein
MCIRGLGMHIHKGVEGIVADTHAVSSSDRGVSECCSFFRRSAANNAQSERVAGCDRRLEVGGHSSLTFEVAR